MIDKKKFDRRKLTDEQLDLVTGGKRLTHEYIETLKKMLNAQDNKKFADERRTAKL